MQWQSQAQTVANEKSMFETQYQQLHQTHTTLEEAHKTLVLQQSPLKTAYDRLQQDYEKLSQQYQEQFQQIEARQHAIIELQVTFAYSIPIEHSFQHEVEQRFRIYSNTYSGLTRTVTQATT